jgi:hypothetical protein
MAVMAIIDGINFVTQSRLKRLTRFFFFLVRVAHAKCIRWLSSSALDAGAQY